MCLSYQSRMTIESFDRTLAYIIMEPTELRPRRSDAKSSARTDTLRSREQVCGHPDRRRGVAGRCRTGAVAAAACRWLGDRMNTVADDTTSRRQRRRTADWRAPVPREMTWRKVVVVVVRTAGNDCTLAATWTSNSCVVAARHPRTTRVYHINQSIKTFCSQNTRHLPLRYLDAVGWTAGRASGL